MKKKIILGISLIVLVAIIYFLLGGAEQVNITHENVNDYVIVGVAYEGRYRSKELRSIYEDVKQNLETGVLEGVMVVINYDIDPDSLESGFIKQFLGVQLANMAPYKTLDGYTTVEIKANSSIKAQISAHNLVMPSPEKINRQIEQYAQTNHLNISKISIEKYVSDRELIIEIPIVE